MLPHPVEQTPQRNGKIERGVQQDDIAGGQFFINQEHAYQHFVRGRVSILGCGPEFAFREGGYHGYAPKIKP